MRGTSQGFHVLIIDFLEDQPIFDLEINQVLSLVKLNRPWFTAHIVPLFVQALSFKTRNDYLPSNFEGCLWETIQDPLRSIQLFTKPQDRRTPYFMSDSLAVEWPATTCLCWNHTGSTTQRKLYSVPLHTHHTSFQDGSHYPGGLSAD